MGRIMARYKTKIGQVFLATALKTISTSTSESKPFAESKKGQPDAHDSSEEIHAHPCVYGHQDHRGFQAEFKETVVYKELEKIHEASIKVSH